jgi:hypothetical protein
MLAFAFLAKKDDAAAVASGDIVRAAWGEDRRTRSKEMSDVGRSIV